MFSWIIQVRSQSWGSNFKIARVGSDLGTRFGWSKVACSCELLGLVVDDLTNAQTKDGAPPTPPMACAFLLKPEIRGPRAVSPRQRVHCTCMCQGEVGQFTHPTFYVHLDTENGSLRLRSIPHHVCTSVFSLVSMSAGWNCVGTQRITLGSSNKCPQQVASAVTSCLSAAKSIISLFSDGATPNPVD